ncbi:MAG TPA: phosphoribosylanthranilate isomerase [Candidatus Acidoferrales bacterium]
MTRVKICGITNWADAKVCVDAGASAIGLNFYAASPRSVSPAAAWGIIRRLPPFVEAIGVFVNWQPEAVSSLARALRLHGAQLHGDESASDVETLARQMTVIKAMQVKTGFRLESLKKFSAASGILLDGFRAGLHESLRGGTGATVDWKLAASCTSHANIILAGGLTPANVAEAISIARPYAVDVASGVESKPGKKDARLVREFMSAVAAADGLAGKNATI